MSVTTAIYQQYLSPDHLCSLKSNKYPCFEELLEELERTNYFDKMFGQKKGTFTVSKVGLEKGADPHFYIIVHKIQYENSSLKASITYLMKNKDNSAREVREDIEFPVDLSIYKDPDPQNFRFLLIILDEKIKNKMRKLLEQDKLFVQQTRFIELNYNNPDNPKETRTVCLECKFAKDPPMEFWGAPLIEPFNLQTPKRYLTGKNWVIMHNNREKTLSDFTEDNSVEDPDTGRIAAADMLLGTKDWHRDNILVDKKNKLHVIDLESIGQYAILDMINKYYLKKPTEELEKDIDIYLTQLYMVLRIIEDIDEKSGYITYKEFSLRGKELFCKGVQEVLEKFKRDSPLYNSLKEKINSLPDEGVYIRLIARNSSDYRDGIYYGPKLPIPYYIYNIQKQDLLDLIDYYADMLEAVSPFEMKVDEGTAFVPTFTQIKAGQNIACSV